MTSDKKNEMKTDRDSYTGIPNTKQCFRFSVKSHVIGEYSVLNLKKAALRFQMACSIPNLIPVCWVRSLSLFIEEHRIKRHKSSQQSLIRIKLVTNIILPIRPYAWVTIAKEREYILVL